MHIVKVPAATLFVSQPNPAWFGNPANKMAKGWDAPNWLTSRFHFSFAEHFSGKSNYGVLRVLNDDRVQPKRGFGEHPHSDMEIITYIVEGELTHKDSMGTSETLGKGSIQFMTAGKGVMHSEHNLNPEKPLRFIQMWIMPRSRGLTPNYGSATVEESQRRNSWAHLVGEVHAKNSSPVHINQDANIFATELDAGASVDFDLASSRQAYFVCLEGEVQMSLGGEAPTDFERHDAAEVAGPRGTASAQLKVQAGSNGAHCLLIEMAAPK